MTTSIEAAETASNALTKQGKIIDSIDQFYADDCVFIEPDGSRRSSKNDQRTKEEPMPIQTIAQYRVKPSGVDKVKRAIAEFVPYVRANEPGTRLYLAWQQKDDPTRFVHFFIFEDEAAHAAHASSAEVKRFEAAYGPELAEGPVVFTDYELVATNQRA
jgi:quinol monooxygenase YgiN